MMLIKMDKMQITILKIGGSISHLIIVDIKKCGHYKNEKVKILWPIGERVRIETLIKRTVKI